LEGLLCPVFCAEKGEDHLSDSFNYERGGIMGEMVLVVDDELEIRDLLSSFLTEEGYEVILAS
jgi:PleD family two-component response regulator